MDACAGEALPCGVKVDGLPELAADALATQELERPHPALVTGEGTLLYGTNHFYLNHVAWLVTNLSLVYYSWYIHGY